jgi:N-acetylglucosamine-6-phosphate deacetylase
MSTFIKNGCIVSPGLERKQGVIEIEGERIKTIHDSMTDSSAKDVIFDAEGNTVLPGFIDLHIHGAKGFDITDGSHEAVEAVARAKLSEGVTTFCPTTLTLPHERLVQAFEAVASYEKEQRFAKLAGIHLEGPYLNPDYAGAQNLRFLRKPDLDEVLRLNAISRIAIVTFAIEAEGGIDFTRELAQRGIIPSCGHSAATYAQFKAAKEAGLKHLTHYCNQMSGLHHREVGLVGAGLLEDELLLEMICDRIHLSPEMIALTFKLKSQDRIALVTDAMCAAGMGEGRYQLGGLEVEVKEGAARLVSKDVLAGSILPMNVALRNVQEITGLPLNEIVGTTSWNQANALCLEGLGRIEEGYIADIVVLDERFRVKATFVNGEQRF